MLPPGYLDSAPDRMIKLYAEAETAILEDMARKIAEYDFFVPAAEHQAQKLMAAGVAREDIIRRLSELTGKTKDELNRLFAEAGKQTIESDGKIYRAADIYDAAKVDAEAINAIARSGMVQTSRMFENIAATTANTATRQFEDALDSAWVQVSSGAFDSKTAVKRTVEKLASDGLNYIIYPTGHRDTVEVAVRRALVTGLNQTALRIQDELADELECDLVETTAHAGARPEHAEWQGRIFSRSGKSKKYPDFRKSTGYGTGAGLGGWNCRHSFYPYIDGMKRAYSHEELERYNEKSITYNGEEYTEYEASQLQRGIERKGRKLTRMKASLSAAGQDYSAVQTKLDDIQKEYKHFCDETGLKPQRDRMDVVARNKSVENKLQDAAGHDIIKKSKASIVGKPDTITQVVTAKGGITRNYYDSSGRQYLQISNNGHDHKKEGSIGRHGEHAHDYFWNEDGTLKKRCPARELNENERRDNADII